jgi:hypothetical protein
MELLRSLRCIQGRDAEKDLSMKKCLLFLLSALAMLPAACAGLTSSAASMPRNEDTGRAQCPVTLPPGEAFVPPRPWPERPPDEHRFWYGGPDLWTALPLSGEWAQLADWDKFWLWSADFDVHEDETPDFVVSARRLDGEAPGFSSDETTNAYHPDWHWAMLTGAQVAEPGCWQFDVAYKEHTLDFVLWVPQP